ncbi:hypothetical protein OIU79_029485 [Salix purpurea]|uniref:Uncharacterized protein n=1 Tax=Salix purpurea TaxID=77065 RepID=A0A9Q0ZVE8_SALPP|nr:hypothetical protein OIU79_029485 [Salix purpurea]
MKAKERAQILLTPLTGAAASCAGELSSSQASFQDNRLEEWDGVFLPVYALVFLLQIHKWIARHAMPDVWKSYVHPETQMITDYLKSTHIEKVGITISSSSYKSGVTWDDGSANGDERKGKERSEHGVWGLSKTRKE